MELTPRYDGAPVIDVAALIGDPSYATIRQRDRLAGALSDLSPEEWAAPSRCDGWSVQDVAEHLAGVNRFWLASIGAGLRGEPTRMLASFDPVKVPAAMVETARGAPPAETLEKLAAGNAELAGLLRSMSERDWDKLAEAPAGHIPLTAVCAHALWDAWIHERDVLVPLGRRQQIEPDEVEIALAYAATLGPALYVNSGQAPSGSLAVRARRPDLAFTVEVGHQVTLRRGTPAGATATAGGDAVDLLEALSSRAPHPPVAEDHLWLVDGLHRAFDRTG